jgi:signal transduction histidine kinase
LGLGLYITKHIKKKSDGIITILSEENEGTKVSIFPIHKNLKNNESPLDINNFIFSFNNIIHHQN